jgi:hypothetical protein
MANLEILALDTVTPQIRAPGVGDGYSAPRDITMAVGTTLSAQALTAAGNVTLSNGSANQVQYLNASKVLVGSSNLTFDGTTLSVNTLSVTNAGAFPLGAVGTPSITFVGDLNTGIWSPAADTIAASTAGIERMRLDSAGNLGLGVTPSAWNTAGNLVLPGSRSLAFANAVGTVVTNGFNDGSWKYVATAAAARYDQNAGAHAWFNAVSGTAGNAISFTQAMTLDASGNLGIGASSPTRRLDVNGAIRIANGSVLEWGGTSAAIAGESSSNTLFFYTSNVERIRIDSSGNLGLGTTTPAVRLDVVGAIATNTSLRTPQINNAGGTIGVEGVTASFPALKRSSTTLQVRLADDSADAAINASQLTTTAAAVDQSSIVSSGYSLTGSSAASLMDLAGTWNTSGTPAAIKLNLTDTASNAASLLLDLQTGSTSRFSVRKDGLATAVALSTTATTANESSIASTGYSLTGSSAVSLMDLAGTWNTTGTPTGIKLNLTDTASDAASLLMDLQTGGTSRFNVAKTGTVTLVDAANVVVGTSTGTKIGTATSQKIGFWDAAPIAQPTTGVAAATVAATGVGDVVAASTTFDGYTIPQIVKAMRNAGLLA